MHPATRRGSTCPFGRQKKNRSIRRAARAPNRATRATGRASRVPVGAGRKYSKRAYLRQNTGDVLQVTRRERQAARVIRKACRGKRGRLVQVATDRQNPNRL
jgi:hypothetical protein